MRAACLLLAFAAPVHAQSAAAPSTAPAAECREYASKLDSCVPYTCTFTHPITGDTLERKIIGLTAGNCATIESMPGRRKMQCEFPPDMRKTVAAFVRETQAAEAAGKTISGGVSANGDGKSRPTASVDAKSVVNPLQQAMERGICKIGG